MTERPAWKAGDRVLIGHEGRVTEGVVMLASPNGRSLALQFDGIIAGHAGAMPVLRGVDGAYRSIVTLEAITLTNWTKGDD